MQQATLCQTWKRRFHQLRLTNTMQHSSNRHASHHVSVAAPSDLIPGQKYTDFELLWSSAAAAERVTYKGSLQPTGLHIDPCVCVELSLQKIIRLSLPPLALTAPADFKNTLTLFKTDGRTDRQTGSWDMCCGSETV